MKRDIVDYNKQVKLRKDTFEANQLEKQIYDH
jgi:hypothetical protein